MTGRDTRLKVEDHQATGPFKDRGALNKIRSLTAEERVRGVTCGSAGNHAQAVSYFATRNGIKAKIVMPGRAPLVKVANTRAYGAEVILHGASFDEAQAEAMRLSRGEGLTYVRAFDDEAIIAGQETIGLAILEQSPEVEAVVVPVGGGGLIGGVAVRRAGEKTLPPVRRHVDEIVTLGEEEVTSAILSPIEREKTVAEGAGGAGEAAPLENPAALGQRKTVAIVCGGNIDPIFLARIIERGLMKDGRLGSLLVQAPAMRSTGSHDKKGHPRGRPFLWSCENC